MAWLPYEGHEVCRFVMLQALALVLQPQQQKLFNV